MEFNIKVKITEPEKLQIIRFLIKQLYGKKHFSVSIIRDIYNIAGINLYQLEIYNTILKPLHCVNWENIPSNFKEKINNCVAPFLEETEEEKLQLV